MSMTPEAAVLNPELPDISSTLQALIHQAAWEGRD
jgi:hypothetical protein